MQIPCKDCTDRKVGCHARCDPYRKYKEENEKVKKKRYNQQNLDVELFQARIRCSGRVPSQALKDGVWNKHKTPKRGGQ